MPFKIQFLYFVGGKKQHKTKKKPVSSPWKESATQGVRLCRRRACELQVVAQTGTTTDWRAIPQVVVSRSPALGATRKQERKSHFKGCRVGRDFRFRKAFPRNGAKLKVTLQDHTVNAASVVVEQSQRLEFCFYCFVPHISFQMRAGLAPNASLSKNRGKV